LDRSKVKPHLKPRIVKCETGGILTSFFLFTDED
jgi:hypothetical protein